VIWPNIFLLDQRQPVGGVYLIGSFNRAGGMGRYNLARFDASGALDPGFVADKELSSASLDRNSFILANSVTAPFTSAVQVDGKLLLLAKLPVTPAGAMESATLARLNLDGSLDADFHGPVVGTSYEATSNTITLPLASGKILFFTDGILERLNPDGSRDASFAIVHIANNGSGAPIAGARIIVQSDERYLLYGKFDAINGVTRKSIARVGSDGELDPAFDPGSKTNANERFTGAVLQPDQKILLYGAFTGYPGTNSNCLIRVLSNGDVDSSFKDVQISCDFAKPEITKLYLQPDGRIILVGVVTAVDGVARHLMARLSPDGSLDNTFDAPGFLRGLPSVLFQSDGKLILYGDLDDEGLIRLNSDGTFDTSFFNTAGLAPGYAVLQLALLPNNQFLVLGNTGNNQFVRLNSNGDLDQTYHAGATLFVASNTGARILVPTADGKVIVGGVADDGLSGPRFLLERLNNDGSVDPGFDPGIGPSGGPGASFLPVSIGAIAIQTDGKIIVSGYFSNFDHANRPGIVRLETYGSVDPTFNPGDGLEHVPVRASAIAIAPNGQIYATGKFIGQAKEDSLGRINPDGTLDPTFQPAQIDSSGKGPVPTSLAVQPDGKLLFTFGINGRAAKAGLGRFNADGTLDGTFAAEAGTPGIILVDGQPSQVRVQADGKIVLGGSFLPNSGASQADTLYIKHANLERFNSDGTPDSSFDVGGSGPNGDVTDVFLEPNGAIVIGGNFTYVNEIARRGVAVLTANGDVSDGVDPGHGPDNVVTAVAAQADGKLLITGPFTNVGAMAKDGIARLLVPSGQLLNLSTRMQVLTGENVLITGFIVTGTVSKKILIRGLGPSLPLSGQLNDPMLELFDGAGRSIGTNDDWRSTQEQEIKDTTIPPTNDRESALVKTVPPGNYTAVLAGANNGTGIGLVEVHDLSAASSQLANISTRGLVGRDNNVLIAGVIVGQSPNGNSATVLVRAIGPSLAAHAISVPLPDPSLELRDANGGLVAQNDNWRDGQKQAIEDTLIPPKDDRESALVQVLSAGNYTAIVAAGDGATGVGLIEIYSLQ
jgi:uncharacterized delta-60 repeat protein